MMTSNKRLLKKVLSWLLMMVVFILPLLAGCDSSEGNNEIILQNFTSDETYFVAGTESNITFTVDVKGSANPVNLCTEDGTVVGVMHDDGLDGDATADDGTYTYMLTDIVSSDTTISKDYFVKASNVTSENVKIYFFARLSEESAEIAENDYNAVNQKISDIEAEYADESGYVPDDKKSSLVEEIKSNLDNWVSDGTVLLYEIEGDSIFIKLMSGLAVLYSPSSKDTDSVGSDISMTVITCQPCFTDMGGANYSTEAYSLPEGVNYVLEMLDDVSDDIDDAFDNYTFSSATNYDDSNVTLNIIKSFGQNQIILWHGHGYYGPVVKSCLVTGEAFDWNAWWWNVEYFNDCVSNRIANSFITGYDSVIISSGYIDKYCSNMNNSLIYLAACSSGKTPELANAFLGKGAAAVVANSETIIREYNVAMLYGTLNNMNKINPETENYYTLQEALNIAKGKYGMNDSDSRYGGVGATPTIFGGTDANNYRLADYVPIAVDSFTIPDSKTLTIGQIDIIEPEITPEDATEYTIKWTSSDESVVTVNPTGEYGILTAKSKGTATITAELTSGNNIITKSTEVRVASKGRDTVLVLDVSGSMTGTPLEEMKKSALQFCDDLLLDEYNNRVAIVCFDDTVKYHSFSNDLSELKEYINNITDGGATNMTAALVQADEIMSEEGMDDHIKNIVIMADGLPNRGQTSYSGSAEFSSSGFAFLSSGEEYANAVVDTANDIMQNYNMYSLGFFHSLSGYDYDNCSKLMSKLTNMENGYHEVDQAENLQFEFGDIAEDITDGSKIVINIACPVDVSVSYEGETLSSASDSYKDSASFGTLQLLGSKQDVKVLSLDSDKVYDVELCGTDTGTMDYSVNYLNENDEIIDYRNFSSIPITETTKINSSTDNSTTVNLNIDNDGDGVIDIVWGAESCENATVTYDNTPATEPETTVPVSTQAETQPTTEAVVPENDDTFMLVIIVVCSVVLLFVIVLVIVFAVNGNKHKNVNIDLDSAMEAITDADEPVIKAAAKPEEKSCDAVLEILSGSMKGMEIPLKSGEIIALGKNPSLCQVVFTSDYPGVSRLHCTVMYDKNIGKFFVTDSSSNGTYFSTKRKLEKSKRTAVQNGTILHLSDENCAIRLIVNSN